MFRQISLTGLAVAISACEFNQDIAAETPTTDLSYLGSELSACLADEDSIDALLASMLEASTAENTNSSQSKKVYICHFPPGNPENYQTLSVSSNAVKAHIGNHIDLLGACENYSDEQINAILNPDQGSEGEDESTDHADDHSSENEVDDSAGSNSSGTGEEIDAPVCEVDPLDGPVGD